MAVQDELSAALGAAQPISRLHKLLSVPSCRLKILKKHHAPLQAAIQQALSESKFEVLALLAKILYRQLEDPSDRSGVSTFISEALRQQHFLELVGPKAPTAVAVAFLRILMLYLGSPRRNLHSRIMAGIIQALLEVTFGTGHPDCGLAAASALNAMMQSALPNQRELYKRECNLDHRQLATHLQRLPALGDFDLQFEALQVLYSIMGSKDREAIAGHCDGVFPASWQQAFQDLDVAAFDEEACQLLVELNQAVKHPSVQSLTARSIKHEARAQVARALQEERTLCHFNQRSQCLTYTNKDDCVVVIKAQHVTRFSAAKNVLTVQVEGAGHPLAGVVTLTFEPAIHPGPAAALVFGADKQERVEPRSVAVIMPIRIDKRQAQDKMVRTIRSVTVGVRATSPDNDGPASACTDADSSSHASPEQPTQVDPANQTDQQSSSESPEPTKRFGHNPDPDLGLTSSQEFESQELLKPRPNQADARAGAQARAVGAAAAATASTKAVQRPGTTTTTTKAPRKSSKRGKQRPSASPAEQDPPFIKKHVQESDSSNASPGSVQSNAAEGMTRAAAEAEYDHALAEAKKKLEALKSAKTASEAQAAGKRGRMGELPYRSLVVVRTPRSEVQAIPDTPPETSPAPITKASQPQIGEEPYTKALLASCGLTLADLQEAIDDEDAEDGDGDCGPDGGQSNGDDDGDVEAIANGNARRRREVLRKASVLANAAARMDSEAEDSMDTEELAAVLEAAERRRLVRSTAAAAAEDVDEDSLDLSSEAGQETASPDLVRKKAEGQEGERAKRVVRKQAAGSAGNKKRSGKRSTRSNAAVQQWDSSTTGRASKQRQTTRRAGTKKNHGQKRAAVPNRHKDDHADEDEDAEEQAEQEPSEAPELSEQEARQRAKALRGGRRRKQVMDNNDAPRAKRGKSDLSIGQPQDPTPDVVQWKAQKSNVRRSDGAGVQRRLILDDELEAAAVPDSPRVASDQVAQTDAGDEVETASLAALQDRARATLATLEQQDDDLMAMIQGRHAKLGLAAQGQQLRRRRRQLVARGHKLLQQLGQERQMLKTRVLQAKVAWGEAQRLLESISTEAVATKLEQHTHAAREGCLREALQVVQAMTQDSERARSKQLMLMASMLDMARTDSGVKLEIMCAERGLSVPHDSRWVVVLSTAISGSTFFTRSFKRAIVEEHDEVLLDLARRCSRYWGTKSCTFVDIQKALTSGFHTDANTTLAVIGKIQYDHVPPMYLQDFLDFVACNRISIIHLYRQSLLEPFWTSTAQVLDAAQEGELKDRLFQQEEREKLVSNRRALYVEPRQAAEYIATKRALRSMYQRAFRFSPYNVPFMEVTYEEITSPRGQRYYDSVYAFLGLPWRPLHSGGLVRVHPANCVSKIQNWEEVRTHLLDRGFLDEVLACQLPAHELGDTPGIDPDSSFAHRAELLAVMTQEQAVGAVHSPRVHFDPEQLVDGAQALHLRLKGRLDALKQEKAQTPPKQ
ncbi:uncharacterized protein MONBRDRAFT_29178 [Monosiga brevicollis MX1]|uniref:Uncharacterized protein n=1 Tax=Monosiga brevicollis TaxID=81824 RepID=A9VAC2_MONBE|nr:uncharacterized protein MONBRDRAFT_29178 [Monosiga brevicollis MX1]EDQ85460.1 predicted protein [Monosiga brevicollis MX1]|eukprot:XP_001749651.1 hypothetical protein [Monosiga brevicollis MX1]